MSDITRTHLPADRPDHAALSGLASGQAGYFTAHQAEASGFTRGLLAYHTKAGRFARIRRGLYRLPEHPRSANETVIAAWLSVGKDSTVVSHLSALHVLKLTDSRPDVVHLTVPRSRRNLPRIAGVKIHTSVRPMAARDLADCDGLPVTGAVRSILDSIESGAPASVAEQAAVRAIRNGAITADDLRAAARERGRRAAELVDHAAAVAAGPARRRASVPVPPDSGPGVSDPPPLAGDRMAELMKHLSTLPPADQELLRLHFEQELGINRIAGMKNIPPDSVRDSILRSLVVLRSRILDA